MNPVLSAVLGLLIGLAAFPAAWAFNRWCARRQPPGEGLERVGFGIYRHAVEDAPHSEIEGHWPAAEGPEDAGLLHPREVIRQHGIAKAVEMRWSKAASLVGMDAMTLRDRVIEYAIEITSESEIARQRSRDPWWNEGFYVSTMRMEIEQGRASSRFTQWLEERRAG